MMKKQLYKLKNALLVLVATLGLNACNWLELYPEGETLLEDYWKSGADIESVVASCYRSMMENDFMTKVVLWGEMRSDNMIAGTQATEEQKLLLDANILTTNSICNWAPFYVTINYCNTILHYAPAVLNEDKNLSYNQMKAYCAEAQAVRALCYFYLVRTFGDVPLILTPTIDDSKGFDVAKTDGKVVLDTMIVSLNEAKQYAQNTFGSYNKAYNKGRFTKQSIRALLADIYLWQGYYDKCLDECNEFLAYNASLPLQSQQQLSVIDEATKSLLLQDLYYIGNANESIYELQFTSGTKANESIISLYGGAKQTGQMAAARALNPASLGQGIFESNSDVRSKLFVMPSATQDPNNIAKYITSSCYENNNLMEFSTRVSSDINWIFYRLSDIYLMRAESLVELASNDGDERLNEALYMVNRTYMRANPSLLATDTLSANTYNSVETMRSLVLAERRREFLFEGKRWFDLLRLARRFNDPQKLIEYVETKFTESSDNASLAISKMSTMDALYLPIIESEIESNALLEQNPFYQMSQTTTTND